MYICKSVVVGCYKDRAHWGLVTVRSMTFEVGLAELLSLNLVQIFSYHPSLVLYFALPDCIAADTRKEIGNHIVTCQKRHVLIDIIIINSENNRPVPIKFIKLNIFEAEFKLLTSVGIFFLNMKQRATVTTIVFDTPIGFTIYLHSVLSVKNYGHDRGSPFHIEEKYAN